jgi:menaquinone-specific isochorismate synthase
MLMLEPTMLKTIHSHTIACAPIDPLQVLAHGAGQARVFWAHTEQNGNVRTFAGYGIAAEVVVYGPQRFRVAQEQLAALFAQVDADARPHLRAFGGFAFADDFAARDVWGAFAAAHFIIPRVLFSTDGDTATLTLIGTHDMTAADAAQVLAEICRTPAHSASHAKPTHLDFPVSPDAWARQIKNIRQRIHSGTLSKVVLSRTLDAVYDGAVNPLAALAALTQKYPATYRFLFEPQADSAFYGATPELLAQVDGGALHTAALAGSRPRGADARADSLLSAELFNSAKDRQEHAVVVDFIHDQLQGLAQSLTIPDEPTLYPLRNIQHLYTPVSGPLRAGVDVLDVVAALHPTPALGGYPQRAAVTLLQQLEATERGWYAAPIGWVDAAGDGMFAVAIRSAVSKGSHARLYAGAGIMGDSDAAKEWDETALKFRPMMDALNVRLEAR